MNAACHCVMSFYVMAGVVDLEMFAFALLYHSKVYEARIILLVFLCQSNHEMHFYVLFDV